MTDAYQSEKSAPADRHSAGPFDSAEVQFNGAFLDLGSIRLPTKDGLQVRLEVEEPSQRVVAVTLEFDDSTLQLQAFAARSSSGPVKRQMRQSGITVAPMPS